MLADYTAMSQTAAFPTSQLPAGYEAAYPYTTAAYAAPTANYYAAAAAVAQPLGHLTAAHYQPQQIQERLQ
jgi:zinc transporter ZupT